MFTPFPNNPFIRYPNTTISPNAPEGPGDIYKNLIDENKQDTYYRKYNNEWTVYNNDNQGWVNLPSSYPEMLNNRITTDKGKQALYRQGNPEAIANAPVVNAPMYNPTQGLNMPQMPKTVVNVGTNNTLETKPIDYSKLDEEYDNAGAPVFSSTTPNIQPLQNFKIEDVRNPIPNIQPLQNFKIEDVIETKPINPEPIKIQTLDATGINSLANNMPLPGLKQYPSFHGEYERTRQLSKDEAIVAKENTIPEIINMPSKKPNIYENIDLAAKDMPLPGLDEEASRRQSINNILDINNYNLPNILKKPEYNFEQKDITEEQTQTTKNKFGTPEAYYLGKSMLDATALISNMVQPQPPSMQMKIPHYERQRLDPTPYDAMRSQMRDQGTQAYRLQRENISQASDLMKGLSAVTSGTQQGLMNVGMQQAAAEQQIQGINQQISMQEQQQQTQMLNQETATNYQIQQQAQQYKDQMVSAQLQRLGDTAGAYAKYVNMKDIVSKQDAVNKAAIQSNNDIQNAMLQYQMHKDAMDSDEYKSAWAQHWTKSLDQMSTDKIKDDRFGALKEYYGEMSPRYSDYQRIAMDPTFTKSYYQNKNNYENFQRLYPGGVAPDKSKYSNDDDYNKAVADYQKAEASSKAFTEDKSYKQFEQMQQFWTEIGNERNESGERKKFADQYMQQRGYYTTEQLLETVKEALDRSKQSLEFGG